MDDSVDKSDASQRHWWGKLAKTPKDDGRGALK